MTKARRLEVEKIERGPKCEQCNGRGWYRGFETYQNQRYDRAKPCPDCGGTGFSIARSLPRYRLPGGDWFSPELIAWELGVTFGIPNEEIERLTTQLESAKSTAAYRQELLDESRRISSALRGVITRMKKRIAP